MVFCCDYTSTFCFSSSVDLLCLSHVFCVIFRAHVKSLSKFFQQLVLSDIRHFVNQHPTSGTSHIRNIPPPEHPTSRTSHLPNIPHPEHPTSRTSHIPNILPPEHPTSPTFHMPNMPLSQDITFLTFYILSDKSYNTNKLE